MELAIPDREIKPAISVNPRILVVDDDPSVLHLLCTVLQAKSYHVETAANGLEGLRKFNRQGADTVLLDVRIPGLDGLELCEAIREHSNVPVVFITGTGRGILRTHMPQLTCALGATCFMDKPINTHQLLNLVSELIPQDT